MKKLKKLLSIVLAVAMVMSLAIAVEAVYGYEITINDSTGGYVYQAYQIFAGDYDATSGALSNVTWGTGVTNTSALLTAIQGLTVDSGTTYPFQSCTDAADVAKVLADTSVMTTDMVELFAKTVANYLSTTSTASTWDSSNNNYVIDPTSAGYYLILNSTVPETDSAYTSYILKVTGPTSVNHKRNVPSVEKTETETNDSNAAATSEGEVADYDVGDHVPFTLTANLPDDYASYTSYSLIFHDTLSDGLSFDSNSLDVTVYTACEFPLTSFTPGTTYYTYTTITGVWTKVADTSGTPDSSTQYYTATKVGSGYDVATASGGILDDSTATFEVQIANTNALYDDDSTSALITVNKSSKIVVTYTAELLSTAVNTGETNTVYMSYSNNPNSTDIGKTTTTKTTVFTYDLNFEKTKENGEDLPDAQFTLYKMKTLDADATSFVSGTTYYKKNGNIYTAVGTAVVTAPQSGETYYYFDAVGSTQTGSGTGSNEFSWEGLDAGVYYLEETETPAGYNTMVDLYFSIVATTTEVSGNYSIDTLYMYAATYDDTGTATIDISGTSSVTGFTGTPSTGIIAGSIANYTGSELPGTGGIGTTIFYVVGGILVLAAAGVILINRKKIKK